MVSIGPRVSRGWWHEPIQRAARAARGFNRAARFARLVADPHGGGERRHLPDVSIGPRVSRGWWLPARNPLIRKHKSQVPRAEAAMTSNRTLQLERSLRTSGHISLVGNVFVRRERNRKDQQHTSSGSAALSKTACSTATLHHIRSFGKHHKDRRPAPTCPAVSSTGRLAVIRSAPVDPTSPGRRPSVRLRPAAR